MLVPPIIENELRRALRRYNPIRARLMAGAVAGIVSLVFLLVGLAVRTWGAELFHYLFLGSLYAVIIRPAQIVAGLISEERRNETLELLFLTGMTSFELFIGKVLGAALVASCELLAITPFLALPFLSGGMSPHLFIAAVVCLPTLLFFVISVAILASVLCRDDAMALATTAAFIGIVSCATPVPYFLGKLLSGQPPFSAAWLSCSPGYLAWMVGSQFSLGSWTEFWSSVFYTWLWTLLCFCAAGFILSRNWRTDPNAGIFKKWWDRWQIFLRGTEGWRSRLSATVLASNPYQWLAQRDRRPILTGWGVILTICIIWIAGWALWPSHWPSTMNFFITAMVMKMVLDAAISQTAARRIGYDRRDGNFELLLTTPLSPTDIIQGQVTAVREQFRPLRHFVLGLYTLMLLGGFLTRTWNTAAVVTYLMVWTVFFFWCSGDGTNKVPLIAWIAANTGRPNFAVFRSSGGIASWFWIIFQLRNLGSLGGRLSGFPTGSFTECVIVVFIGIVILIIAIAFSSYGSDMHSQFVWHLRSIVQEPVPDPHDPRYKKWKDVKEPFPSNQPKRSLDDLLKTS